MAALRLVSTEDNSVDRVGDGASATAAARGQALGLQHDGGAADWLYGVQLPSKEVLLTLLWVLRTEERKRKGTSQPGRPGDLSETSALANGETFVLKSSSKRRLGGKAQGFPDFASLKRRRVSE